jgi:hypothetical protein
MREGFLASKCMDIMIHGQSPTFGNIGLSITPKPLSPLHNASVTLMLFHIFAF